MRKLDPNDPEDLMTIEIICDAEEFLLSEVQIDSFEIKISLYEKLFLEQLTNVEEFVNSKYFGGF